MAQVGSFAGQGSSGAAKGLLGKGFAGSEVASLWTRHKTPALISVKKDIITMQTSQNKAINL